MKRMTRGMGGAWLALVLTALLTACGSTGGGGPAPSSLDPSDVDVPEYKIGPGDSLQVFVWRHPELSASAGVRPDGKISTPLVQDIDAAGKTPMELAREVEERLKEFVRSPTVTVMVQGPRGDTDQQIKVVGTGVQPRTLPYSFGMTLLDVMIQVGGLSEYAAGNRAKVVRANGEAYQEIRVRLEDLLDRGDMSQNLALQPGDVLIVPESRF